MCHAAHPTSTDSCLLSSLPHRFTTPLRLTMAGSSLDQNPPNADRHITPGGSDWLWAVFAIMALSTLAMVAISFMVCPSKNLLKEEGNIRVFSDRGERVSSIILRPLSLLLRRLHTFPWPRTLVPVRTTVAEVCGQVLT